MKRTNLFSIASLAMMAVASIAPRAGDDDEALPGFEVLVAKYGNTVEGLTALSRHVYGENHTERERKRAAKKELAELKGKVPPEGAVVLTGDDAKAWAEFNALGKPADLKARLDTGDQAVAKIRQVETDQRTEKLAGIVKYNVDAFKKLVAADGLELEEGSETVDGKPEPVVYVKQKDGNRVKVTDYATQHWGTFLPSLTAQGGTGNGNNGGAGGGNNGGGNGTGAAGAGGVFWPNQSGGGSGGNGGGNGEPTDPAIRAQSRRDAGTNPLAPKTT